MDSTIEFLIIHAILRCYSHLIHIHVVCSSSSSSSLLFIIYKTYTKNDKHNRHWTERQGSLKILTAAFEENIDIAKISLGGALFILQKVDDLFSRRSRYTA